MWNVILNTIVDNKIVSSSNNPKESGRYLCTCIIVSNNQSYRYLEFMEYNKEKDNWHDCNREHAISHNILAWTNLPKLCDFNDFKYISGGYLVEKE